MKRHQAISLSVYNAVKIESKQRRSPMYSALAHELDKHVVEDILASRDFKEYQFSVIPKQYGIKIREIK